MIKTMTYNWKTSLAGAAAILGAVAHLLNAVVTGDTSTIMPDFSLILAGVAGLFAKDAT